MTRARIRQDRQQVSISCFLHHHLHLSVKDTNQGSNSEQRISVIAGEHYTKINCCKSFKGTVHTKMSYLNDLITLELLYSSKL